jgi:hypothetical protein
MVVRMGNCQVCKTKNLVFIFSKKYTADDEMENEIEAEIKQEEGRLGK